MSAALHFVVDIEPTNRCNANCYFCPRDATPHQGLMTSEIYEQALLRAAELREIGSVQVNMCGLGEPLLNKLTPSMVRRAREEGYDCGMSSNGALLDERRGTALLEAGLQRIFINVGEVDDSYEEIYGLPFEKTRDNVVRFAEMAGDAVEIFMVLVDHRRDRAHLDAMRAYWGDFGLDRFMEFEIMNRGGALFVDHMQYAACPEREEAEALLSARASGPLLCNVPFISVFVGYDGNYYLCCSDWKKEAPVGSVFDSTPFSIMEPKLLAVMSGEPVCKTCNLDPRNLVTDKLRALHEGEATQEELDQLVEHLTSSSNSLNSGLNTKFPGITDRVAGVVQQQNRRLIPVVAE